MCVAWFDVQWLHAYGPRQGSLGVAQLQEKSAMEERLNEVETRVGLAEDLMEELNLVVYRQQQQIELLQSQLRHLHQQLQNGLTTAGERHPGEEIPPHY